MKNDKYDKAYPATIDKGGHKFALIGHWNDLCGYYESPTTGEIFSMDRLSGKTVFRGYDLRRYRGWLLDGTPFSDVEPWSTNAGVGNETL